MLFGGQVEPGPEVLEGLGVVAPFAGHRSQDCRERMAGHAQPVGPGTELARVIQQVSPMSKTTA
jgi:hypothetical protein